MTDRAARSPGYARDSASGGLPGAELTSLHSPRLKAARQLAKRALRTRSRSFLADGPQAVAEALAAGVVTQLYVTAAARSRHPGLIAAAASQGITPVGVSGEVMVGLSQTVTPQGVLAVCGFVDVGLDALTGAAPALVAMLASVRDPGNAGTVLRTADAAGADGVVFSTASVDVYNGKCVRASAGSLFHLPLVTGVGADAAVAALRRAGLRVLAADGSATTSLDEVAAHGVLAAPVAWLFGNEAWGLPPDVLALADEAVAVPIYGRAESLNLAAAAAVCLYTTARAQRAAGSARAHRAGGADGSARPGTGAAP